MIPAGGFLKKDGIRRMANRSTGESLAFSKLHWEQIRGLTVKEFYEYLDSCFTISSEYCSLCHRFTAQKNGCLNECPLQDDSQGSCCVEYHDIIDAIFLHKCKKITWREVKKTMTTLIKRLRYLIKREE